MFKKTSLALVCLFLSLVSLLPGEALAARVPLYRYYSSTLNRHLYSTLWYGSQFGGTDNWRYETTEGYLENTQLPGLVPVNRFHNSSVKGYYMTTNPNWPASYYGFVFERTEGYASNTQDMCGCSTPMYWAYSSAANNHFFTTNKTEYDQAVAFRGYSGGGVAFYVYGTQQ